MSGTLTFLQGLPWWSFVPLVGLVLHFGLRLAYAALQSNQRGKTATASSVGMAQGGLSFENSPIRRVYPREVITAPVESIKKLHLPIVINYLDKRPKSRVSSVANNIPAMPVVYWINLAIIAFLTTATGLTFALIPVLILAFLFLDYVSSHNVYRTLRRRILRHIVKRRKAAAVSRLERQLRKATQARKSSKQAASDALSTVSEGPFEPLTA